MGERMCSSITDLPDSAQVSALPSPAEQWRRLRSRRRREHRLLSQPLQREARVGQPKFEAVQHQLLRNEPLRREPLRRQSMAACAWLE